MESNLNRRRYAQNDDTLYVAPEDERTDYVRVFVLSYVPFVDLFLCCIVATTNGELVQWCAEVSVLLRFSSYPTHVSV